MSSSHLFLSDEWIAAAQALRAEYESEIPQPPVSVAMNVVVTEIPHRVGELEGHIDTSDGNLVIEEGHLATPDLTLTVDYGTAKAAFVTRDPQAVMQAFLGGKILVDGDASKLLALQAEPPSDRAIELYQRLSAMTADD